MRSGWVQDLLTPNVQLLLSLREIVEYEHEKSSWEWQSLGQGLKDLCKGEEGHQATGGRGRKGASWPEKCFCL